MRVPLSFYAENGKVWWLLTDEQRRQMDAAVDAADGEYREALAKERDGLLEGDTVARTRPAAFEGEAVFDDPCLPLKAVVDAEAIRRAREMVEAEERRAREASRKPMFTLSNELVNQMAYYLRAELTFRRLEGTGADGYPSWASLPDAVKERCAAALVGQYVLSASLTDFLSVTPAD